MDERKSVEGTNAARDKPMSPDSSAQLEHAAWQDGARTPIGIAHACRVARWRSYSYRHRSSMQRGKMVLVLLSASLAHAASARPALVKSTAQERKIYGVFQLAPHKSSMRIQAWPVHQTRPNIGVGLRRWIDGIKRRGPAAQGARTVRGPVAELRMNLGTTCTLNPCLRRNSSSSHSS